MNHVIIVIVVGYRYNTVYFADCYPFLLFLYSFVCVVLLQFWES